MLNYYIMLSTYVRKVPFLNKCYEKNGTRSVGTKTHAVTVLKTIKYEILYSLVRYTNFQSAFKVSEKFFSITVQCLFHKTLHDFDHENSLCNVKTFLQSGGTESLHRCENFKSDNSQRIVGFSYWCLSQWIAIGA